LILLIVGSVVWSFREAFTMADNAKLVARMQVLAIERVVLRNEYQLYLSPRARVQWVEKTEELGGLIAQANKRFAGAEDRGLIQDIRKAFDGTNSIVRRLMGLLEEEAEGRGRGRFLDAERRLTAQLLARVYNLNGRISMLRESASQASTRAFQRSLLLILFFAAVAVVFTVLNSLALNRLLAKRVTVLRRGAERIGGGNLNHRIALSGSDELADLARSTNEMAARLQESHTSVETLQREVAERERTEERLRYVNRLYAMLSEVNEAIVRTSDAGALFGEICRVAVGSGGFLLVWVGVVDAETGDVVPIVAEGRTSYVAGLRINLNDEALSAGPTGRAIKGGTIIICADIETDPQMGPWRARALGHGFRSSAAVPLRQDDRVVGALNLYAGESGFFSSDEVNLLEEVAGNISYALGAMESANRRRQAEEELRLSGEKFRDLFDNAVEGIFQTSPEGGLISVNRAFAGIFGYDSPHDVVVAVKDIGSQMYVNSEDRQRSTDILRERRFLTNFECPMRRRDGTIFWASINSRLSEFKGEDPCFEGFIMDITERKLAEEALREKERGLATLIANLPGFVYRCANDRDWTMVFISDGCDAVTGYSPDDFLRNRKLAYNDIVHPDYRERLWLEWQDLLSRRETFEETYPIIDSDGRTRWVWERGRGIFSDDGRLLYLEGFITDITARKEAEEEIKRLNAELESRVHERTAQLEAANRELEAFAYSVSHDLRAPLRAMEGFSSTLAVDYGGQMDEQGRHYLERIRAASVRMGQLISDLLNLSRISRQELTRKAVDLTAMAEGVAQELRSQSPDRHVRFIIAPNLTVRGDARLLRIALENLMSNAWKFTAKKDDAIIEVSSEVKNGETVYSIKDNGVGFDMAYASKLFAPFQRLHGINEFPGTGVGLATVQRIIHRHGGRIWAEAKEGEGATFSFTLP
jgi:PAS domain S-box-containing protein